MCRIYNSIGCLKTIKLSLEQNKIYDFSSIKEIINFRNSYQSTINQLINVHEKLIEEEKSQLMAELSNLAKVIEIKREESKQQILTEIHFLKEKVKSHTDKIASNFFNRVETRFTNWNINRKIKGKENSLEIEVDISVSELSKQQKQKSNRLNFLGSNFDKAVKKSAGNILLELERKKSVIDSLNNSIYGAIGEHKVVKALEKLSDDYYLINDFVASFSPAIYNRQENDYIKSVQIDHILVGPSGLFLIETKNWSEKSLESLNLRSPVDQIRRMNFAIFNILNNERSSYHIRLNNHHWGNKKIPIKNLVVLTNAKPKEDFQHVKILTVNELIGYVNYFKPIFSSQEIKQIVDMLLWLQD
ncbi:nuclease-related domain-containing protein [Pedobacter sp.]